MLITVGSIKGSPGATSLAVGMAARWPNQRAVLVEADSDGGDLGARFGASVEPGLTGLVLKIRADGPNAVEVDEYTCRLPLGADVVLAPPSDAAGAVVDQLPGAVRLLRRTAADRPVIVDLGRLVRRSAVLGMLSAADHLVVVVAPRFAELTQLASRIQRLRAATRGQVWVFTSGAGTYDEPDVRRDLQLPLLASVAHDKRGAGMLAGRHVLVPGWWKFPMVRAAQRAAAQLSTAGLITTNGPDEDTEVAAR